MTHTQSNGTFFPTNSHEITLLGLLKEKDKAVVTEPFANLETLFMTAHQFLHF